MNDIITRSPEVIAAEINAIKRTTAKYVLEQSIEIGRLLCEAKEAVPFGEWGAWLEENCAYSTSNANNLMRIHTEYGEDTQMSFFSENKLELYGNLNRSQAIALLALPSAERAEFVRENDVPAMSVSELEEKIKEAKESIRAEMEERVEKAESEADRWKKDAEKLVADSAALKTAKTDLKLARQMLKDEETARKSAETKAENLQKERDALKEQLEVPVIAEITEEQRAEIAATAKEEAAAEIRELQNQNAKLHMAADPTLQKFEVYFGQMQECFNKMQELIKECADSQMSGKLRGAVHNLLDSMQDRVFEN